MIVKDIIAARQWQDLFPEGKEEARKKYRALIRETHPDVCSDPNAEEAFIKVRALYTEYQNRATGTTGKERQSDNPIHVIEDDVFSLVRVNDRFFWFARHPRDNDLTKASSDALRKLSKTRAPQFFPELLTSIKDSNHRAGVEVSYPHGIWSMSEFPLMEDRNIVWVFKRILVALILAHEQGIIHANLTEKSIWILPEDHGLVMDNWGYSVGKGMRVRVKPDTHIPEQYLKNTPADEWVDIAAAATLILKYSMPTLNPQLRRFFESIKKYKTTNAAEVLNDFNEVTEDIFGPPKFNILLPPPTPKTW